MSLCILTNTTALFPPTSSSSGQLIRAMSMDVDEQGLSLPDVEDFQRIYTELEREFRNILVLAASGILVPVAETAQLAARCHGGTAKIVVVDTLQIGPGLGILTQLAARKAVLGACLAEVEEYVRAIIPYLFTIICPGGTPRYQNRHVLCVHNDQTGTLPVYSLEDGQLAVYKKVRTQRHLLENLQEFLGEFEKPQHLAYFHGKNAGLHTRPLRETAGGLFPGVHFNDLDLNASLTALLGEHAVGLTVLEMPGDGGL
jgi:fatty acid-binding protein DegV